MKKNLRRKVLAILVIAALCISMIPVFTVYAAPADAYWVGGTGNTSDAAGHWAAVSGGAPGAGNAPDQTTNVHFDALSFGGAGQIVTVDAPLVVKDFDWSAATNNPALAGANPISIYGSLGYIAAMDVSGFSGALNFWAVTAGHTITTGGHALDNAFTIQATGGYTFQDTFTLNSKDIDIADAATVNTNGQTMTVRRFFISGAGVNLTLGASIINVQSSGATGWSWTGAGGTLTANTSVIKIAGAGKFEGGGKTYNEVQLNGAAQTITGSNTVKLVLPSTTTQTITFTDGTTQTLLAGTALSGSIGKVHTLQGSGVGGWNVSAAAGTFNEDYISISRSTAAGGATFNANGASVNGGNNVGWNFPLTVTTQNATGISITGGVTSGTFNGTLVNMGGANDTVWFEYGPTTAYGFSTTHVAKTAPGTFTASIPGGLTPGDTYHYRAAMNNGTTTSYGSDVSWTFTLGQTNTLATGIVVIFSVFVIVVLLLTMVGGIGVGEMLLVLVGGIIGIVAIVLMAGILTALF